MKKFFLITLIFLIILSTNALADGMFFVLDKSDNWNLFDENKQFSVIDYSDGVQKMIITLNLVGESNANRAVWIFPIPAKPDEININFVEGFPEFRDDTDIEEYSKYVMGKVFETMWSTQIYPVPILSLLRLNGLIKGAHQLAHVHKSISYMGLNAELVSADDGASLWNYLSQKGLTLNEKEKSLVDEYVGKGYSFVVSWISGEDFRNYLNYVNSMQRSAHDEQRRGDFDISEHVMAISITFPTKKIYYPLKLTSIYGNKRIPIVIYVLDYVKPKLYFGIRQGAEVKYAGSAEFEISKGLEEFFNDYNKHYYEDRIIVEGVDYTKIKINTLSKHLTRDLWIEPSEPLKVRMIKLMNKPHSLFRVMLGLTIFILCSCLASLFSAIVIFGKRSISKWRFALLGLSNFLTLIGFLIISYVAKVDKRFVTLNSNLQSPPTKKVIKYTSSFWKVFIKILFVLFIIFLIIEQFLILSHYLYNYFLYGDRYFRAIYLNKYFIRDIVLLLASCLLSAAFVWVYHKNKKILWFVVLFSVFFLVLTFISELLLNILL